MKKVFNGYLAFLLSVLLIVSVIPAMTFTVSAMTLSDYISKYTAFINDSRWANNTSWGASQTPKLSSWGSQGCCAYAADFEYYMYGTTGWKGLPFYSVNQISTGSILHINHSTDGEHWIVILERNGDSLYTAEGSYASRVNISRTTYRINNGNLQQSNYGVWRNYSLIVGLDYSITSGNNPQGFIDACVGQGGSVRVTGWAFDMDEPGTSIGLHIYIGGPAGSATTEGHAGFVADLERADVNSAYGISGNHGFDFTVNTNKTGSQTVYVYGLNIGEGMNALIGQADVNISDVSYNPKVSMYNGHIYEIYSAGISWTEAKRYCENIRGGHLMTVNSAEEHDFIKSQLTDFGVSRYYIGGTDEEVEGEWRWVTGEPFTYTYWGDGEPNGGANQNYLIFITSSKQWDDYENTTGTTGFICEIETDDYTPISTIRCNDNIFELYNHSLTYDGAELFCEYKGGNLVSITSISEQAAVYQLLKKTDCPEYCWIGAKRSNSGDSWIWEDGSDFLYENWGDGQPDNWRNEENCAEIIRSTGYWNDVKSYYACDEPTIEMCFILEKKYVCAHEQTEIRDAVAPTNILAGYTGDTYCSECGEKLATGKLIPPLAPPDENSPQVIIENKKATAGKTVDVKISLKNNPGIASMKLRLEFGSDITLTNVAFNNGIGGNFQQPQNYNSPVLLNWYDGAQNANGDFVFATLTFKVSDNATVGEKSITVTYDPEDVYNIAEQNITFAVTGGIIEVTEYTPGDINGDTAVNNKDLTRLFQYLSGWDVEVNTAALDINGDGNSNNKDLTRLFQYLSGWDVEIY